MTGPVRELKRHDFEIDLKSKACGSVVGLQVL